MIWYIYIHIYGYKKRDSEKIKKIIFSILSTICVLFFFTLDSYASTTSSVKGIIIDERMQKREELESSYDMYGCYTTGWWGKEHHHEALIARIQTACGVYDYYNKDEDTITVYCYSWMRSNLADNVRVRQNRSSQNIRLYMPNGNLNGSYSPGEVLPSTKYRDIQEYISF